jgi:hypothetical protein
MIVAAGFAAWTGAHIYRLIAVGTAPLPFRTLSQAATWLPNSVNVQFGDGVELVSYDLAVKPAQALVDLTLAWRSLAQVNENYLLQVNLVDETGTSVSHWMGYNGRGRVPSMAWDPGDIVFDRLALPLPNLPAGKYQLQVQLLGRAGEISIKDTDERTLTLTEIVLPEASQFAFGEQTVLNGNAVSFAIWKSTGAVNNAENLYFRYPGTISVILADTQINNNSLQVKLVDPNGHEWAATRTAAHIHTFVIGPRWQSGSYHLQITAKGQTKLLDELDLTIENWWQRHFQVPEEIEVPLEANFANQIRLLGYKLPQKQVEAGEAFPVTLYWQAPPNVSPQANFTQFNHLHDSSGTLRGGYDRRPLEYYSTLLWAPGEIVVDGYAVPVDPNAPPGKYYLDVGYYLVVGESAVNLPLVNDGKMSDVSSVTIGPVEVIAPSASR